MHYLVLCCDYDGTLAHDGAIDAATITALEKLKRTGRKLVMVTGRELPDLQRVCARLDLFDYVVAENGALLYRPDTHEERALADPPRSEFVAMLRARNVQPLSVGRVIVATWEPNERTVLDCIRDLGLELHVIFNKGAVMILPAGINKASGLVAAFDAMKISPHNAVGIGDAENDHAFLSICECSVAVANALPAVQATADIVTKRERGAGVAELIAEIVRDDLASRAASLQRHRILLGYDAAGHEVKLSPQHFNGLLLGTSGSGKSTIATGLLERLDEQGYSFCVVDPEGDYESIEHAVTVGTAARAPDLEEVRELLDDPNANLVVNLVGLPIEDRPRFFASLFAHLQSLRARTGRPHWIVLDEAHHLLPVHREAAGWSLPPSLEGVLRITVHANLMAHSALRTVNTVIAIGNEPKRMLHEFAAARGIAAPVDIEDSLAQGEALLWRLTELQAPLRVRIAESRTERRRHIRKYAEGELPEDRSFYFRGPDGKLNLRAQNLILFLQLGDGVDDATWLYHLRAHDYSRWVRGSIKDEELADELRAIEDREREAGASRREIRNAIESRYTLPAS